MSSQSRYGESRGNANVSVFARISDDLAESIVLIPLERTSTSNSVAIERRALVDRNDRDILHVASGAQVDFVIYKNGHAGSVEVTGDDV